MPPQILEARQPILLSHHGPSRPPYAREQLEDREQDRQEDTLQDTDEDDAERADDGENKLALALPKQLAQTFKIEET